MKKGFILFVVLGLVSILAVIGLFLIQKSFQSKNLTQTYLLQTRAQTLSFSGYEFIVNKYLQDITFFDHEQSEFEVGQGTLSPQKDVFLAHLKDLNGRININDGIKGGLLDRLQFPSSHEYHANALDPYPHEMMNDSFSDGCSGFNNLRLRRILNAYGEVHRFVDHVCQGNYQNFDAYYGVTHSLPTPIFSTSSLHSADGPRVEQMAYYLDGLDPYPDNADMSKNTGLGDHIIFNRPQHGYLSVNEVKDIVNNWAALQTSRLSSDYLKGTTFFDLIKDDLTTTSFEDHMTRFYNEFDFGNFDYGIVDTLYQRLNEKKGDFYPDFFLGSFWANFLSNNSVSLINLNQASFFVRSAVFYAPTNVSYACESAATVPPYVIDLSNALTSFSGIESMSAATTIGVMPPVFADGKEEMLNGWPSAGRSSHLMSLRDAMHLALAYENYVDPETDPQKVIHNFDDFKEFLVYHEKNGYLDDGTPPYERVLTDQPYDIEDENYDFNAGGLYHIAPYETKGIFMQDYVSQTLPHILSCIRRIPSWYCAPIALMSPYMVFKPDYKDSYGYGHRRGKLVRQGVRRVEDFVFRITHPKVCFLPSGQASIVSQGQVKDTQDQIVAENKIEAEINFFETRYLRTQEEFVKASYFDDFDPLATDPEITIGPETMGVVTSDTIGLVGLNDFDDDLTYDPFMLNQVQEYGPQVVMNFAHKSDESLKGFENTSGYVGYKPEKKMQKDPWVLLDIDLYDTEGKTNMEGGAEEFEQFDTSSSCDLSPFNGAKFISTGGHGQQTLGENGFVDSLYWRLEDWLDPAEPIGSSVAKGIMTFWFRMPSDYDYPVVVRSPSDMDDNPSQDIFSQSFTRVIAHLNFWEKYEYNTLGDEVERPVSITVGLKKTKLREMNIFARYDSGSAETYLGDSLGYVGPDLGGDGDFRSLATSVYGSPQPYDFLGFWNQSDNLPFTDPFPMGFSYQAYRWAAHRSSEVSVKFANKWENGPGTWHRASVYWDLGWVNDSNRQAKDQLYIDLHDDSNKEDVQEFHQGVRYAPVNYTGEQVFSYPRGPLGEEGKGSDVGLILPHNSMMILSLGEVHARRPEKYVYMPKQGVIDAPELVANSYRPYWRLNSVIDNFRLWMGPHDALIPEEYFSPDFISSSNKYGALRYYVVHEKHGFEETHEPTWVLQPAIEAQSQVLHIGARVYYPPDSENNTPYVYLSCSNDSNGLISELKPKMVSQNEQDLFYNDQMVSDQFRLRLQYKAFKPILDGDLGNIEKKPLVYSGSDHVTNIAWIKEVSYRFVPPQGIQLVKWTEQSVSTEFVGDDDDDGDDDDAPGGSGGDGGPGMGV